MDERKLEKILLSSFLLLSLVISLIYIVFYCLGIASFYGQTVDFITAIELLIDSVLDLFESVAVYRNLFGIVVGVTYFIVLILLVKKIIFMISIICRYFSKSTSEEKKNEYTSMIDSALGSEFFYILIFMIISALSSQYTMSARGEAILIMGVVMFVLARALFFYVLKYSWKDYFLQLGYTAIFVAAFCLLITNISIPTVEACISELKVTVSIGGEIILQGLGMLLISALSIAIIIYAMYILNEAISFVNYQKTKDFRNVRLLAYGTAIFFGIELLIALLGGASVRDMNFKSYFILIEKYIPELLSAIVLCLAMNFSMEHTKRKQRASEVETKEDLEKTE